LKIIHILSGDLWAGAEVQAYNLLRQLKPNKYMVEVILFNKGVLEDNLINSKIDVHIIDESNFFDMTI